METLKFCVLNHIVSQILVAGDKPELLKSLGDHFVSLLEPLSAQPQIHIAISGGSLPAVFGDSVSSKEIDWSRIHFWFVDERYVPLDSKDSNYKECETHLFSRLSKVLPADNVHAIIPPLELEDCALEYENRIKGFLPTVNSYPQFDIVLLVSGMGPDGHTASLFPRHALLQEKERFVASIADSPKPPPQRLTLTLPVINNAKHVAIIATGDAKKEVLGKIFNKESFEAGSYPIGLVRGTESTLWFVDKEAMALVNRSNL